MSVTDMLMALGNPDAGVRVQAERALEGAQQQSLGDYLATLTQELGNAAAPVFARRMAASLIRNAIAPSLREVAGRQAVEARWRQLPAETRQAVRAGLLAALSSDDADGAVRTAVANTIGCVSRVELPAGGWPDLVTILLGATASPAPQHQEVALVTLGYVCEEGRDSLEVEEALSPYTTDMLSAMLRCLQDGAPPVQLAAIKALSDAMEYIHANMQQEGQRDCLVAAVCAAASGSADERTRTVAVQCLVKIAELYYGTLPKYISELHRITNNAIHNDVEEVGLQALQFWIAICDTEAELLRDGDAHMCQNYCTAGLDFLVGVCLELLVRQEEGQTEDDWNLSLAASKLLQSLADAVGAAVQDKVMPFVFEKINSADWREREGALMAFGCIIGVDDADARTRIQDTVMQAIPGLLQYMGDATPIVADTAAWVAGVVCEHYVDAFLDTPHLLQALLNATGPLVTGGDAMMCVRGVNIITNLALAYEDAEPTETNELSPYFADLVAALMGVVDNATSSAQRQEAQECLNTLYDAAAADVAREQLPPLVLQMQQRMAAQLAPYGGGGESLSEDAEEMLSLFCGGLSALAHKLGASFAPHVQGTMELLLRFLQLSPSGIQPAVWVALGKIAYCIRAEFGAFVPQLVPYLKQSLETVDEPDNMHVLVGAVGDLCINCPDGVSPFVSDLLTLLYNNLTNPDIDRDLKCTFLSCIGDMILNVLNGQTVLPYLDPIVTLAEQMFAASAEIDVRGDADSEDYVLTLWECISGLFSSIISIFRGAPLAPLLGHVSNILGFSLHVVAACGGSPDGEDTALKAAMVLGDLAKTITASGDAELIRQGQQALLGPSVSQALAGFRPQSRDNAQQLRWVQSVFNKLRQAA